MKNNIMLTEEQRENMPFKEYGENIKVKVVDFDECVKMLVKERKDKGMSMIIELKAIRIDKHKELSDTISWTKDPLTAIYYGMPFGLHQDGNVKWRKVLLKEFNSFDLRRPDEAKQWVVCMMHSHVKGTPLANADPVFYIYDADVEASATSQKAMTMKSAIDKAHKMPKDKTLNFHRFLAIPAPTEITPQRIKNDIMAFAMENPEEFMNKYDDPNRAIQELFNAAKSLGAITYDLDKGFVFRGTFLGFTDLETIRFLKEDTTTLNGINSRVDELDSEKHKFNKKGTDEI